MGNWLDLIVNLLGAAPIVEKLLAGFGQYFSQLMTDLFGVNAGAKTAEVVDAAERITNAVTTDAQKALEWVQGMYPDFLALEAAMPGTMQAIQAKSILMSDVGVPHSVAARAVEAGLANARVKAAG